MKKIITTILLSLSFQGYGIDFGASQIIYLKRLIDETKIRYKQLQEVIRQSKDRRHYEEMINQGIDNAVDVLMTMPLEDGEALAHLRTLKETLDALEELYGVAVTESPDSSMFKLHDESIAESIKLLKGLKKYAQTQERNAREVFRQAQKASPKGAQRMAAVTNSQILHALSQLIKINGQILKLQSEQLGIKNKEGKESVGHFYKVNRELGQGLKGYRFGEKLPRF